MPGAPLPWAQMVSLTLMLLTRDGASSPVMEAAALAGLPLLGVAAWLTVYSLALYMRGLWKFMF
jgi:CDP-diacylglycerol--glycerol-3-phosphate 3-phosphatidyltransferase